jgi:hypothetical protein
VSEATDTAAGEGAGGAGIARARLPADERADRARTAWTRRGGGGFELREKLSGEKAGRRNLVNAEHRDEVASSLRPRRGDR